MRHRTTYRFPGRDESRERILVEQGVPSDAHNMQDAAGDEIRDSARGDPKIGRGLFLRKQGPGHWKSRSIGMPVFRATRRAVVDEKRRFPLR